MNGRLHYRHDPRTDDYYPNDEDLEARYLESQAEVEEADDRDLPTDTEDPR